MTVDKTLDEFMSTLDALIESACACAGDADAFTEASGRIGDLIAQELPQLVAGLAAGTPEADTLNRLEASLARLRDLEKQAQARLVWSRDLEDYIRKEMSGQN